MQRRAQWLGYMLALRLLSTPIVNKLSHRKSVRWITVDSTIRIGICVSPRHERQVQNRTSAIKLPVSLLTLTFAPEGFGLSDANVRTGTPVHGGGGIAGKDRSFHRFPPHLSHNVATFWVKDMQCFADSQPFAATEHPRYGEPDEVVMALRPYRFRMSASGGVA
jgi:hypothetical protein